MLKPVSDVISRLPSAFDEALTSGDLLFFPSTVHSHRDAEVQDLQFELRLCPALQQKSKHSDRQVEEASKTRQDPFAPPYIPKLFVGELEIEGGEYVVLLNKYSVVPKHFLLVTKDFQSQASPLLPSELLLAYLLLGAARESGQTYTAFFNCGELSGASQPHKHLQFIQVDKDGPPIEKLAKLQTIESPKDPFTINCLPYHNYVVRLPHSLISSPPSEAMDVLSQAFMELLDLVIMSMRQSSSHPSGPPSYNVILTLEHLHVIPRSQEKHILNKTGQAVSVNSLGFAGMLLIKDDIEMEAVKEEGPLKVLTSVGLLRQRTDTETEEI